MEGHSIIATLGLQVGIPRGVARKTAIWLVGTWLLALPASALAETVVLPDPTASPEHSELAGAVSLLVRSYLVADQRGIAPRRELALALEAVTGTASGKSLTVSNEIAPRLVERMAADSVVVWELQVGQKGTTVAGMLVGPRGKRLLRISAAAATGDVAELARQLARKLAPAIGATVGDTPEAGLADVRPLLAAESALVSGDAVAASRAVDLAQPAVVARLAIAKHILGALAEDPALPALPRAQARLLRGEYATVIELADAGLSGDPKNAPLRAAKVRALSARKDFSAAEAELSLLRGSRNLPATALAAVALALERGDSMEKKDAALAPLLGRPAAEWRPILPLVATTPPGTFGPRVEAAVLAAAEKLASQEPGLASTLAARALATGGQARQASALIKVQELSAEQIKDISARLNADADSASARLSQQVSVRQEEAKTIAAEAGPEKPTGPPSTLARNLLPVLQGFDGLYEPSLSAIQIAPLPGSGQPFYWPFLVRKQHMAEGLLETLMRSPWELQATPAKVQTDVLPAERLTDEAIASLAHDLGCGALLLYRIRPAGLAPWVTLDLVLYDVAHQRTNRIEASLVGRSTGLVMLNPLMIVFAVVAFLCTLAWAVVISLRGTVTVRVQWDSDAKDELFSISISRSPHTPTIDNLTAYRKKLEWLGKRKRRFEAWNIDQNTNFRGIPRGKWYVHLYGIYTRGRQTMMLREPPQEVEVLPRKTAFVAYVLEAANAEFKIVVVDDHGAVEGARVWLDDERAKAVAAAKDGSVTLKVPKGFHVIRVSAHGMTVERPYHVVKSKVHDMTINLVWERRQEYVSRALERQVDEVSEYITKPPRGSGTVAAAAATSASVAVGPVTAPAAMRSTTNPAPERKPDAGIEISLEDMPIAEPIPAAPAPPTRPSAVAAPPAPPHSLARQTLNLKPLSPEMAQTILPSTLSKPSQSSFRGSTLPPANESSDIVDLLPAADEAPPVDLGPPLDLASNDKTDPSLAHPAPPTHRR
jgi:hypothetical protein